MNAEIDLQKLVPAWQAFQSAAPPKYLGSDSDLSFRGLFQPSIAA
ncbi:MAG: hypothetical protein ACREX9_04695 [Gammaproteobacteria bacterium]